MQLSIELKYFDILTNLPLSENDFDRLWPVNSAVVVEVGTQRTDRYLECVFRCTIYVRNSYIKQTKYYQV